ncbi:MAG: hypothetical protein FJ146_02350 [Deltaproteobacteria bacterium]|nr:hypothetical protein [Deltaproteobacteria bacterium]
MQAVDIGFGRVEWGVSYHRGLGKRPIAYTRTNETLSDEERSRFGAPKCNDIECRVSPVVLDRKTDFALLYTHIGFGIQHEIENRVKIAATLGYSYLARAHIGVENEAGDETIGQQRGVLGNDGYYYDTIIGEHDSGLYAQFGIDVPLDASLMRSLSVLKPSPEETKPDEGSSAKAREGKRFAVSISSDSGILLTRFITPQTNIGLAFTANDSSGEAARRGILDAESAAKLSDTRLSYRDTRIEARHFIGNSANIALEFGAASEIASYRTTNDEASGQVAGRYLYTSALIGNAWSWENGFIMAVDWIRMYVPFGAVIKETYAHPDAHTAEEDKFHNDAKQSAKSINPTFLSFRAGWMF